VEKRYVVHAILVGSEKLVRYRTHTVHADFLFPWCPFFFLLGKARGDGGGLGPKKGRYLNRRADVLFRAGWPLPIVERGRRVRRGAGRGGLEGFEKGGLLFGGSDVGFAILVQRQIESTRVPCLSAGCWLGGGLLACGAVVRRGAAYDVVEYKHEIHSALRRTADKLGWMDDYFSAAGDWRPARCRRLDSVVDWC
jgi:hypothetical protein